MPLVCEILNAMVAECKQRNGLIEIAVDNLYFLNSIIVIAIAPICFLFYDQGGNYETLR